MAVRKHAKSGKWLVDVWIGIHRIRRLMPDKQTAQLVEADMKLKEARGEYLDIKPIKSIAFEQFTKEYLSYVQTNMSEGRYQMVSNVNRVALIPFFRSRNLKDITTKAIEDLKAELAKRIKPSSVNSYLDVLSAMLNLAVKWGHLKASPFKGVKMMKVDKIEPPHLSIGQSNQLLEACRGIRDLYTFVVLGLHTGMRAGEIVNLTWSDVDLKRGVVKVRPKTKGEGVRVWRVKTGDIRDIPLNGFVVDVLSKHPRHITSPYVLHRTDGSPFIREVMRQKIQRAGRQAGLGDHIHPHLLRHTFGTTLAANGVDVVTIQRLMGHTEVSMTMRYLHAAPDRMKGATENLPFGRPIAHNLDTRADGQEQASV